MHEMIILGKLKKINSQMRGEIMKYTTLGKTGLKVSVVGLGGIPVQRTDKAVAVEIVNA